MIKIEYVFNNGEITGSAEYSDLLTFLEDRGVKFEGLGFDFRILDSSEGWEHVIKNVLDNRIADDTDSLTGYKILKVRS